MRDQKNCCGTCRYHRRIDAIDWDCKNKESEYYGLETEYEDTCEEWEER